MESVINLVIIDLLMAFDIIHHDLLWTCSGLGNGRYSVVVAFLPLVLVLVSTAGR